VSLYKAETRRLTKRRFTRWLVLGSLLVLVAVALGTAFTNEKVGPSQIAAAEAQARAEYEQSLRAAEEERRRCEAAPGTPDAANFPADCSELYQPQPQDFQAQWYMPSTFVFKTNFRDMITTYAAILALAAFVIGASYVGAEWSSGGMMNLLLWRPQRLRVLSTKLVAFLVVLTVLSAVVAVLWTLIFVLIANLRGTMDGMTSGAWQSIALTELRALALILVAGAVGFGLASLGRTTALALGATIGAVVVFQFGLVTVMSLARVPFAEAWLLPVWGIAWMQKEIKLENYNSCEFSSVNGCQPDTLTLTWQMSGGLMALAVVLVVGAAMWTMRSRDVT
jgi:ABC-type transport system involved in multi-copper enzyme maturation permease subunit